jgi:hypothetical protein
MPEDARLRSAHRGFTKEGNADIEFGWIERTPASRAVQVSRAGRQGLARVFGVEV